MVDFAQLLKDLEKHRALPARERAYVEEKRRFESSVPFIVKDERMRDSNIAQLKVVTLGDRAVDRYVNDMVDVSGESRSGHVITAIHHADGGPVGNDMVRYSAAGRIVYYESEGERLSEEWGFGDRLDPIVRGMETGAVVTVAGRDVERSWVDADRRTRTVTEFHAMRIGLGEMTMDQLRIHEKGGLADAAIRHAAAPDRDARDAIAKEYLSQPQQVARIDRLAARYERSDAARTSVGVRETGARGPTAMEESDVVGALRDVGLDR